MNDTPDIIGIVKELQSEPCFQDSDWHDCCKATVTTKAHTAEDVANWEWTCDRCGKDCLALNGN